MTLTCVHSIPTAFLLQNRKPSVFIYMTRFLPDLGEKLFFINFFAIILRSSEKEGITIVPVFLNII